MKLNFRERGKQTKGITLIALVITIIILLILAGISIAALTNQGLFEKAKEAKQKTEDAQKNESQTLENYLEQMNSIAFSNVNKKETNPEGAMPKDAIVIEGDANKGIVIKDIKDNEWTWVEVPMSITADKTTDNDIENALIAYAKDYREGIKGQGCDWSDEWYAMDGDTLITAKTANLSTEQKALKNGCGLSYDEYYAAKHNMLQCIKNNGGFWISRYEIGDSTATVNRTSDSNKTEGAVSKPNQIPFNFVTCSQAQTLSSGMSTDSSKTSSLLFGIQWDLTCKFLETKSNLEQKNINEDSKNWGNYKDNGFKLNRGKYITSPYISDSVWVEFNVDTENYVIDSKKLELLEGKNDRVLITTGASETTNKMNIYDLAANVWELTLELANNSAPCAIRGGGYGDNGTTAVSCRSCLTTTRINNISNVGFRASLY